MNNYLDRFRLRALRKKQNKIYYVIELSLLMQFPTCDNGRVTLAESKDTGESEYIYVSLDEVVLMQCTGLKDRKGNLVYEGDIIKSTGIDFYKNKVENKVIIEFGEYDDDEGYYTGSHYGWFAKYRNGHTHSLIDLDNDNLDIIGNIHENPELVK